MHGKVPGQSFLQILFFFSLCYQRNGKVRGEVFSSLVSVRAYSAKFLIGSETLVRKRAKCFMHMYGNCKHLTLAVRFLKIGCQTRTFLKYLCQPSLRAQMRGSWVPLKKFQNSAVSGTEKMRAFWYRGYFFLQHFAFNFDIAFFCFSTWGESSFKACQTCFLVFLYFYYTKRTVAAILFPFLYGAIAYVLLSGLIPISILVQLTSLNILLLSISRVSSLKIMLIACFCTYQS